VAPLRLGGLRGKQSTPSVWLGGTGELLAVGERERQGERTRHGARDVSEAGEWLRYDLILGKLFRNGCVKLLLVIRLVNGYWKKKEII
jgi:hypothetical protein